MSKNILIFSDGTGQAGGLSPDQALSNIYKLYRAARSGPESSIDPGRQVAFYDAGLGTHNDAGNIPVRPIQMFRKLWSAITGTGISRNIADCYEAIIKHYEPGDRIFLFGFSRGAYTARCVGGVMGLCGIPTQAEGGGPLPRFGKALRKIANEAVKDVYEHGQGRDNPERKEERVEKANRFRVKYASSNQDGKANEVPYFIGVFDTVAALGAKGWGAAVLYMALAVGVAALAALPAFGLAWLPHFNFWWVFTGTTFAVGCFIAASAWHANFKIIHDYPKPGQNRWHFTSWKLRFYDNALNTRVKYARHALAIDESRVDFARVEWGNERDTSVRLAGDPEWLRQVWFAGNHSDIGGSYPEDESRLSDISLAWMVDQCTELPAPLIFEKEKICLFGSPTGMQHSEVQSWRESWLGCLPWDERPRDIEVDAPLHPTVLQRFAAEAVLDFGIKKRYRPTNLEKHQQVRTFYQ